MEREEKSSLQQPPPDCVPTAAHLVALMGQKNKVDSKGKINQRETTSVDARVE